MYCAIIIFFVFLTDRSREKIGLSFICFDCSDQSAVAVSQPETLITDDRWSVQRGRDLLTTLRREIIRDLNALLASPDKSRRSRDRRRPVDDSIISLDRPASTAAWGRKDCISPVKTVGVTDQDVPSSVKPSTPPIGLCGDLRSRDAMDEGFAEERKAVAMNGEGMLVDDVGQLSPDSGVASGGDSSG